MSSPTSDDPKPGSPPRPPGGFAPPAPGYLPPGADDPGTDEPSADEPAEPAEPAEVAEPAKADDKPADKPAAKPTPPPSTEPDPVKRRVPGVAWLAGLAAVAAIVGAVLPWFAPTGKGVSIPKAYCLQAGRIGFVAPLVLVVAAVIVLGPRLGIMGRGQPLRPLSRDGRLVLGAGVLAGIVLAIVWYLLPNSYTFGGGTTWDQLQSQGHDLNRGPQVGYVISIVAAAIAVIGGLVIMLAAARQEP